MKEGKKFQIPAIALVGFDEQMIETFSKCDFGGRELMYFESGLAMAAEWRTHGLNIVAVISQSEIIAPGGLPLMQALKKKQTNEVPFLLVISHLTPNLRMLALKAGVTDVFKLPVDTGRIEKRVNFLIDNWHLLKTGSATGQSPIRSISFAKRLFDVVFASLALLALSPVFLITYLLVRLESKGPAFYYSLRVGTGYKIFRFYKFRSMYMNAEQRLKDLKHLNQYDADAKPGQGNEEPRPSLCAECLAGGQCRSRLFMDKVQLCENDFIASKKRAGNSAFIKIKNDPRITKVGNFIRNTSIDELPQLWNVIIGNMSIVGNRPLPLYEAEKLTTDKHIMRFAAPAGITGLWQVEKRGKGKMSEEERLMLDNVYAMNHSFKNDVKLILKTIPALLQKESV